MKRITAIFAALILFAASTVQTNALSFNEELFSLEIPDYANVYYYTRYMTNMTGTMLENAQKQTMLCLIGQYSDGGSLLYSFKVEEKEGAAEDVASSLADELAELYTLSAPREETLDGRAALAVYGFSRNNASYDVCIRVCGSGPSLVITAMYQMQAEARVNALLETMRLSEQIAGPEPVEPETPEAAAPEPETPAEPVEPETPEEEPPASTPAPTVEATFAPSGLTALEEQPGWPERAIRAVKSAGKTALARIRTHGRETAAICGAVILMVILVCFARRSARRYSPQHKTDKYPRARSTPRRGGAHKRVYRKGDVR